MRLSIDITPEQHKRLKSAAELMGLSIEDYVLERTLSTGAQQAAIQELEAFLAPRVEAAERGEFSDRTLDDIFDEAAKEIR